MRKNPLKEKILGGEVSLGVWLSWFCPDIIEFCGHLGFEWVVIDAEHGAIGRHACLQLVRACDSVGMVPVVRVREGNRSLILGYLETGVMGIIVPHINTAIDAQAIVDAVKYAPMGKRGAGSERAANYGLTQTSGEYLKNANNETLVIALIEEVEGIRNLDEILAVEGVDIVGIGSGDLSLTMDLPGQRNHPQVQKVVDEAEARIVASGKVLDAVVGDAVEAQKARARGALMIGVSVTGLLRGASRSYLRELHIEQQ